MPVRVVLGATALVRPRVRDIALAFAEDGHCQPFWSDGIIAEVDRRLPADLSRATRDYLFAELERAFPEARVTWPATVLREVPYVVDPAETHMMSVALLSHADAVVTQTPALADALERVDVEPWTADAFVTFVLDAAPEAAQRTLLSLVRRRWLPPQPDPSRAPEAVEADAPTDAELLGRLAAWAGRELGPSCAGLLAAYADEARFR
ncbi:MAG TPA: PIN domain-containing protein [Rhodococcus sp. (in: high G+C Gram-positive bacteria)]|nr:PIN domain-containing protein [Rhodococcus sp. (in: high G+C Gram-positive bacteria)]